MSVAIRLPGGSLEHMSYEDFERRARDGEIPPETLVRFEAVTGGDFVPAEDLELYHALVDPELRSFLRTSAAPLATAILVGLQVRLYLISKLPGASEFLVSHLANWAPAVIEQGQVHRLFTYGLLHVGLTHLALNLLFLAYVGWNVERALGRANLLAIFVLSVLAGGLCSMLLSPGRPSLGASGGDFGLLAAAVVLGWKHGDLVPRAARQYFGWAMLPYLVASLVLGFGSSSVDNWGHVGGLLSGAALATGLQPESWSRHRSANRRLRWSLWILAAALLAGVRLAGPRLVRLVPHEELGLEAAHPAWWTPGWSFTDDRGWLSPTGDGVLVTRTRVYRRPVSPARAVRGFLDQLQSRGGRASVILNRAVELGGWPGRRLSLRIRRGDEDIVMEALVVTRGAYVHGAYIHASAAAADLVEVLAARIFQRILLREPDELVAARRKSRSNPRSWQPALALGRAAALAGYPEEAGRALERAYRYARDRRPRVAAELLALYADYGRGLPPSRVEELVAAHPDDVAVLVAGADALDRLDAPGRARELLEHAWKLAPGDLSVRRARLRRGMEVETRREPL